MRAYRLNRLVTAVEHTRTWCFLFDPMNIRYATKAQYAAMEHASPLCLLICADGYMMVGTIDAYV